MTWLKRKLSLVIDRPAHGQAAGWIRLMRYGAALLLVVLGTWGRLLLPLDDAPFLLFMPIIFVTGFLCGRGPGILATLLSALAADYLSWRHAGLDMLAFSQLLALALYILLCLGLVMVCDALRRVLARRRGDLEALQSINDALLLSRAELQANEAFLRSVLESSPDCIKILDLDARITFMNLHGQSVMEVENFSDIQSCSWPDFWQDVHNEAAIAAIAIAKNGGTGHFQGPCPTFAGTPKWWDVVVTAISNQDGSPEKLLAISRDITEQKEAEAQQELLNHELGHRLKNMLAMVQAIANQTLRRAGSLQEARVAFESRLIALGTAQDVLTGKQWESAEFGAIVRNALIAHGVESGRFEIAGPALQMSSRCSLALSLALHELATNATKYGALSVERGHVRIGWEMRNGKDGLTVHFRWKESGGPPVIPPQKTGFGSVLIERSLAGYFRGTAQIDYPEDGVAFTLEGPVTTLKSDFTTGKVEIMQL
jgi:PAS domain S-box-containing protein